MLSGFSTRFGTQPSETFRAYRLLTEIFSEVTKQVAIIDPYVGDPLFVHLEPLGGKATIRILTADKVLTAKAALLAYQAFKGQYPNVEMRTDTQKSEHDRYILLDGKSGYHLGHSIKDLGKKNAQVNRLTVANATKQWTLFEKQWKKATPIP